ncbi:MAG: hypothetical protein L0H84_11485, partial [Pseudonocardia sp.]|nr:hypothetical protein [Pseudonocardia sp.]
MADRDSTASSEEMLGAPGLPCDAEGASFASAAREPDDPVDAGGTEGPRHARAGGPIPLGSARHAAPTAVVIPAARAAPDVEYRPAYEGPAAPTEPIGLAPAPVPGLRHWLAIAAAAAAATLIVGAVGGAVGYSIARNGAAGAVAPPPEVSAGPGQVEQVAARVLPSVVQLRSAGVDDTATGSAIVLAPDGLLLTSNHVVDKAGERP